MLPVEHVEGVRPQLPGRVGEGGVGGVEGAGAQGAGPPLPVGAPAGEPLGAVEVVEARGVGDVHELALLGPAGLGHGVPAAAVDDDLVPDGPVRSQVAHVQGGVVPRHVRVVPGDPGQVLAVGGQGGGGDEVGARHERAHRGVVAGRGAVQGDGHQGVDRLAGAAVVLPDGVDQAAGGVDLQVPVAYVPVDGQRDQPAQAVGDVVAVQAPVPGVGDHDNARVHGVGAPAVLVDAGAHVHQLVHRRQGQDLTDLAVAVAAQEDLAPGLGGALLHPVGVRPVHAHLGQAHRAGGDGSGSDGRGPGAVGRGGAHGSSCGAGRATAAGCGGRPVAPSLRAPPAGGRSRAARASRPRASRPPDGGTAAGRGHGGAAVCGSRPLRTRPASGDDGGASAHARPGCGCHGPAECLCWESQHRRAGVVPGRARAHALGGRIT